MAWVGSGGGSVVKCWRKKRLVVMKEEMIGCDGRMMCG